MVADTIQAMSLTKLVLPEVDAIHHQHCECQHALDIELFTDLSVVGHDVKRKLELLLRRRACAIG